MYIYNLIKKTKRSWYNKNKKDTFAFILKKLQSQKQYLEPTKKHTPLPKKITPNNYLKNENKE
jgi:hypothetical protein